MSAPPDAITIDGVRYVRAPLRVSTSVMYDCHLFRQLLGLTVDEIIADWLRECREPDPQVGRPYLCPAIVLQGDRELRRVGPMIFKADDAVGIEKWRSALLDDPDISAALAARAGVTV